MLNTKLNGAKLIDLIEDKNTTQSSEYVSNSYREIDNSIGLHKKSIFPNGKFTNMNLKGIEISESNLSGSDFFE
mgnify:FL=1